MTVSSNQNRETLTDVDALEQKCTDFETILTAHVFNQIFAIVLTLRLSICNQKRLTYSQRSDWLKQRNHSSINFKVNFALANLFCSNHKLEQQVFLMKYARKRKRIPDELCYVEIEEDQTNI